MTRCPCCHARYRGALRRCPFDGATLEPEPDALCGTTIGPYRVKNLVGSGVVADVYQAEDTRTGQGVALKLLSPDLTTDPEHRERFARELQALGRVQHRALPDMLGMGNEPRPWFVMPLYDGKPLADVLSTSGAMSSARAALIVCEIAAGLAVAHAAGVIHRDLSARNVLLVERTVGAEPAQRPVIVDFGLSSVRGETKLTETGDIIGTPHYMSPEQIEGQPPSSSMDHYALGCLWFELIAGRVPFTGTTSAVLDAHVRSAPPELRDLGIDVSEEDASAIRKLLSKDQADRALAFSGLVARAASQK